MDTYHKKNTIISKFIIIKNIIIYHNKLYNLQKIKIYNNKHIITYKSINYFNISSKSDNDKYNKIRELLIISIINNNIDKEYYTLSRIWNNLKKEINSYINKLSHLLDYNKFKATIKAGRSHNYDFNIIFYKNKIEIKTFNIEFKFNIKCIKNAPQFINLMNPSKYLTFSFEEYYYDNYLALLFTKLNMYDKMPNKTTYIKEINLIKPKCMITLQENYYNGAKQSSKFINEKKYIEFYEYCNKISQTAIITYIDNINNNLDYEILNDHLYKTQSNKIYMFLYNRKIYYEETDMNNYKIISVKKNKNCFDCLTQNNNYIKILLRWKNGNGIAFPAFQISQK